MNNLISKQVAINTTYNMCCRWDGEDPNDLRNMMLTSFQELPTIDAVPVVRCKDCKHKYLDGGIWNCPFGLSGGPMFYCGYGAERSEDD